MGGKNNPLTLNERIEIARLLDLGFNRSECARRIGRGKNTIVMEVRRFGKGKYDPFQAEEQAKKRIMDGYKSLSEKNKKSGYNPFVTLSNRVQNLEMQVETLKEIIKELYAKNN